ncbi:MAG: branched-chain amino acid ABC transporter substrate-binding protein [Pseudomonadota bacterium]
MLKSILLLPALCLAIAGCGKKEEAPAQAAQAPSATVVKIGSVAPLTGPQSHLGKDQENGIRMALEEINAGGVTLGGKKVTFELVSEDDMADPKTATVVAQKLADEHVAGVIGHLNSGTSIPASKIYSDAGIAQISPSATAVAYTAQGYQTAFRVMTNDAQQGKVLGEFAAKTLGAKTLAIIDDRTAYGQGLADEVEKAAMAAGASIVAREFTTDKATDFMAILTSIKGKKPDVIFFGGMDSQAGPMAKQLKSLGITAKFLGGDGFQSAQFLKLAGADAEGVYATSPGLPLEQMPGGKEFNEKFSAKYGQIQIYAPYAYDATRVMIEAMRRADSAEPAKYLPELVKTNFNGVTGPIAFDEKGDIRGGAVTVYQVQNGQWAVAK